ncbi:MAG: DinB family protein [Bacteroidota bacterium]|nr:DinB family protein [Bacteroidota bacterium]MDP4213970.1 DinB family protein [Bacteroidota bacterium]MDP4248995.1 DinB family protein [Bacteroidota bacterium]
MDRSVEMLIAYRRTTLKLLEGLSMDSLNAIPPGFNNNLIWNFGHVVVSQQSMCYLNAGLKPVIDETYFVKYRKGTKPEKPVDKAEFETLKNLSETALQQLDRDLENNLFSRFNPFGTSYGVEITNINDVLKILLFHEGLHLGYCMALKRAQGNRGNRSL